MDRRFFAILTGIALIFIGIFIFTGGDKKNDVGNSGNKAEPTSHVYGAGKKAVTLTEYGDFQCSACFAYYPVVSQVVETYKHDIFFQFRHLPLIQIHPNAFAASRAAEAASYQGKFFEMYNKLYNPDNWQGWTQSQRPKTLFDSYAKDIGLNMAQFNSDYGSTKVNDAINADIAAFDKTKATKSTPTFFINGKFVDNSRFLGADGRPDANAMAKVIQEAIDQPKVSN